MCGWPHLQAWMLGWNLLFPSYTWKIKVTLHVKLKLCLILKFSILNCNLTLNILSLYGRSLFHTLSNMSLPQGLRLILLNFYSLFLEVWIIVCPKLLYQFHMLFFSADFSGHSTQCCIHGWTGGGSLNRLSFLLKCTRFVSFEFNCYISCYTHIF